MKIQSAIFKAFFEVFFFVMTLDQCVPSTGVEFYKVNLAHNAIFALTGIH